MSVKLSQRSLIRKQTLEFDDSKLNIAWKSFGNKDEMDIPFENILPNKFGVRKNSLSLFIISGFFYFISILVFYLKITGEDVEENAELLYIILGTILLIVGIVTIENYWRINLSNNNSIKIIKKSPNKHEVDTFIQKLFEKRNEYLMNNYGYINPNISYENQLNNIVWLRKMKVLDDNSFQAKKNELENIFSITSKKIGF
ncbi:hypothetical protein J2X97_001920 [Epilithonimonas hungarica]|uniref:hypothetical protein n=1 Tax=Epilithonimonas hungarica TaxID=454006 RepID=UPI0027882981|nr:hypothetical protein [Epilithonimonas hungarica]MDP9956283.1 hypothetical protein [Epilithonimonas hungarica]